MRRLLRQRAARAARVGVVAGVAMSMVALSTGSAGAAVPPGPPTPGASGLVTDPAGLVNPFIGTGSGGAVVGDVDLFPGASVPFGMLTFSPQTPSEPDGGGYYYGDSSIEGFALTHISGPGCSAYGDFPILPTVGAIGSNPNAETDPFSHSHESATPGSYKVTLSPNTSSAIGTSLSATTRSGIASFTFPATSAANLIFKVGDNQMGASAADVHVVGNDEVTGSVTSGHFCGDPGSFTVHFVATFDRPFRSYGTFDGTKVSSPSPAPQGPPSPPGPPGVPGAPGRPVDSVGASGTSSGAYVSFDTASTGQRTVKMKVAVSYVSTSNAMLNLRSGDPGWSVGAVAAAAHREWNQLLSRVDVGGGTHSEQVQFYTALYHALLDPSVFSDANGQYMGFDNKVHQLSPGQVQYANYSGWDIYRSEVELLAMMAPRRTSQMITSLLNDATQGGWLPKWPFANDYTGEMDGDPADSIIADAYAFGARDFNTSKALAYMVKGATDIPTTVSQLGQGTYIERPGLSSYEKLGYVSGDHASLTLEYALADDSIAQFANALGDASVYKEFFSRAENWQNVYDSAATYRGYSGYFEPRAANGSFPTGPAFSTSGGFGENGFREGNAAQYAWMVPQDLHGLFSAMGGNSTVVKRLDTLFTHLNVGPNEPYYWAGNEPGLEIPWEYDYAGDPGGTQAVVHRIVTSVYSDTPGGEPGNDDLGAMSSWLVWAYLGMYPETPGAQVLALGAPIFPTVEMHLANGHRVNISAPGATTSSYVEDLKVNGKATSNDWLDSTLVTGPATTPGGPGGPGTPGGPGGSSQTTSLAFTLGSSPSTTWGVTQAEEPPSYQAKPLHLAPSTRATLAVSPAAVRIAPDGSTTVDAIVSEPSGQPAVTVTLRATASSGLTVSPAQKTLSVAPGSSQTVPLKLLASGGLAPGYYDLRIVAITAGGAVIAPVTAFVTVAQPGQSIPTAYVTNYSDNTVTPISLLTRQTGPSIPVGAGPDGAVVTPNGKLLFVADNNSNDVTVIDTSNNQVIKRIPVGSVAADVAVTPDGSTVWVTNFGSGTVQPIDVATLTAGTPVTVGSQPERLAINPSGSQAWIANQGSNTVSVVDLATHEVTHTIMVGAAPFGVAFAADGDYGYVSNGGSDTVSVISTSTDKVSATIPTGSGSDPQGMNVSPDGKSLYVTDGGTGGVTPVDTATDMEGSFIPTGGLAYAVSFTPGGSTAWVVDTNADNVVPVATATETPGTPVSVGNAPDGIAITPAIG